MILLSLTLISLFIINKYTPLFKLNNFILSDDTSNSQKNLNQLYMKSQYKKQETEIAKISIQNGCGKRNLGMIYKRYLLDAGYDITESINAEHFGHTYTEILFHKNNIESAIYLANGLGINKRQITKDLEPNNFHDLTLILGKDYLNLKSYRLAKEFNPFK